MGSSHKMVAIQHFFQAGTSLTLPLPCKHCRASSLSLFFAFLVVLPVRVVKDHTVAIHEVHYSLASRCCPKCHFGASILHSIRLHCRSSTPCPIPLQQTRIGGEPRHDPDPGDPEFWPHQLIVAEICDNAQSSNQSVQHASAVEDEVWCGKNVCKLCKPHPQQNASLQPCVHDGAAGVQPMTLHP